MPFNQTDLYTTSAGTKLYNYWNPFVTKFDSQSFYNFEQDNQPLYDLEERTKYLWEKSTGYATSSLFGMPLVVSGSLDATNNNVFTNLQEAVDTLPNIIRTPTLIEVAASGNLGGLTLNNIEIKDGGSLEILNRGFAKIYSGASHNVAVDASSYVKGTGAAGAFNDQGLVNTIYGIDLSGTIRDTSALSVATNVSGLFDQNLWNRTFIQLVNLALPSRRRNDKLTAGFVGYSAAANLNFITSTSYVFTIPAFERNNYGNANYNINDPTIGTADVSCIRGDNSAWVNRNNTPNSYAGDVGTGMTYCNSLSSIDIENCTGPLYIRGFNVDGVSGADLLYESTPYKSDVGIDVNNSDVTLENCSVMRSTTTGARFRNSHVDLRRGFFSYRNYQIESATRNSRKTTGLEATNSTVRLLADEYASGIDYAFNIQAHDIGMELQNSVVTGGQQRVDATETGQGTTISFAYNKTGIEADNSKINLLGNLDVYNNNIGMNLKNSLVKSDRTTVENNNDIGILSDSSEVIYNKEFTRELYSNDVSGFRMTQTLFHRNGTHLNLKNGSKFAYDEDGTNLNYQDSFGPARFMDSMGVTLESESSTDKGQLPSILLDNSHVKIVHPRVNCSGIAYGTAGVVKGGAIYATNGSKAEFLGTKNGATMLIGPQNTNALRTAAAYADKGSIMSFMGPTVLAQFGFGAVANDKSTLSFGAHRNDSLALNASAFNLADTQNHTSVEIHSQGNSCLVANDNSQIYMEDLGSPVNWTVNNQGLPDYEVTDRFVSGGSMQFYPNPENTVLTGDRVGCSAIIDVAEASDQMSTSAHETATSPKEFNYNYYITHPWRFDASAQIRDEISIGGLCVQLTGESAAYVNNVHFLMGHVNADGSFFDPSSTAAGCNQLRIWNVADSSKLYGSHLGVSGSTPSGLDVYHGPRSTFFSGTETEGATGNIYDDSGLVAFSALGSTPDTGSLSVLDYFGLGVGVSAQSDLTFEMSSINNIRSGYATGAASGDSIFGCLTPLNKGPFRIFFSPKTEARFLGYASGSVYGNRNDFATPDTRPMQHLAQGYSLSGPAGVPGFINSDLYHVSSTTDVLFATSGGFTDLSGYYYPSALLVSDRGTQVYLDENSANVFANAKHAATQPRSGRSTPKISIYKSSTGDGGIGDGGNGEIAGYGAGIKSIEIFDIRRNI